MKGTILFIVNEVFLRQGGMERFNRHMCMALQNYAVKKNLKCVVISKNDHLIDQRYIQVSDSYNFIGCGGSKIKFVFNYIKAIVVIKNLELAIFGLINHLPLVVFLKSSVKKVSVIHGFEAWERLSPIKRMFINEFNEFWSVSDYTKKEFIQSNNINKSKVKLLTDALDYYWFEKKITRSKKDKFILCVTRLDAEHGYYKGVDTLIRSYSKISIKYPEYKLIIVGNGSDISRLQDIATQEGIRNNVKILKNISDEELKDLYISCTIFALPSKKEGFGLVFLEAMASKKPVIGGNHGGTPEVIEDGKTGLLVNHGNEKELSSALDRLLSDQNLRLKMGQDGYKRLNKFFLYQNFELALFSYLSSLIN
jgi:phosphatidylinositol alpha-1,6-mannosyltransferase